jgi:hypothetical protein
MEIQIDIHATLNWTHVGQYHAYGDTHRVCEIHTETPISEEILLALVKNGKKLPYEEWKKNTSMPWLCTYFRGYYTLTETPYGYKYEGVEPFTD